MWRCEKETLVEFFLDVPLKEENEYNAPNQHLIPRDAARYQLCSFFNIEQMFMCVW